MTENMREFIKKNSLSKIVAGMHVTADLKEVRTNEELANSVGTLYQFNDDSEMLLTKDDARSAPDFQPVWDL